MLRLSYPSQKTMKDEFSFVIYFKILQIINIYLVLLDIMIWNYMRFQILVKFDR